MQVKSLVRCALVLAVGFSMCQSASAAFVVNGSFEQYTGSLNGSGYYQHIPNGTAMNGSALLPGWGVGYGNKAFPLNTGVDLVRTTGPLKPAADGIQFVDLNGTGGPGSVFQTLVTVPGQQYSLSYSFASTTPAQGLASAYDGTTTVSPLATTAIPVIGNTIPSLGGALVWSPGSLLFTALSGLTTIVFDQVIPPNGNTGLYLDNVAITAVPEASTLASWGIISMLGLALVGKYGSKLQLTA